MARPIKDLIKSLRETAQADRLILPGHYRRRNKAWPICATCGREPYSVNLEDLGDNKIEIRAKCGHKAYWNMTEKEKGFEDSVTLTVPFGTKREEYIKSALSHTRFFDPTRPPK